MSILVDSSIWIDYFRDGGRADALELLIEENLVIINDLILAELIPPLKIRKRKELIALLNTIKRRIIAVDWEEIIDFQTTCLTNGINGVGIPDLIIAQNALQGGMRLMSADKHLRLLAKYIGLEMYR